MPGAGCDGGRLAALRRAGAAADQRGDTGGERFFNGLRADQVYVSVDAPSRQDLSIARDDLGGRADDQSRVHAVHRVRVSGLAERDDAAVADTDIGFDDAPVVEHDRAGDDRVGGARHSVALDPRGVRHTHRFADHFPTAEHCFVAACAVVVFDLDEQVGVGQADAVAGGGSIEGRVTSPGDLSHRVVLPSAHRPRRVAR